MDGSIRVKATVDTSDFKKLNTQLNREATSIQKECDKVTKELEKVNGEIKKIQDETDKDLKLAVTDEQTAKLLEIEAFQIKDLVDKQTQLNAKASEYKDELDAINKKREQLSKQESLALANSKAMEQVSAQQAQQAYLNKIKSAEQYDNELERVRETMYQIVKATQEENSAQGYSFNTDEALKANEQYQSLRRQLELLEGESQKYAQLKQQEAVASASNELSANISAQKEKQAYLEKIQSVAQYKSELESLSAQMGAYEAEAQELASASKGSLNADEILKANKDYQKLNSNMELLKDNAPSLGDRIKSAFSTARTGIKNTTSKVKGFAGKIGGVVGKFTSLQKSGKKTFSDIGSSIKKGTQSLKKFAVGLIGARGLFGLLKQAVSSYLSTNDELSNKISAIKNAFGQLLAPAVEMLVGLLEKALSLVDAFVKSLTGVSIIAKANASAVKGQTDATKDLTDAQKKNQKQMAGFDVANAFSDSSSSSSNSNSSSGSGLDSEASSLVGEMEKLAQRIKNLWNAEDFYGAGEAVAEELNKWISKVKNLDWDGVRDKVNSKVKAIAEALNGFTENIDTEGIGNIIGEGFMTGVSGLDTFLTTYKWDVLGSKLAQGLNGIIDKIDGKKIGKTISDTLTAGLNLVNSFLEEFKFFDLGSKLGNMITGFDWKGNMNKLLTTVTSALNGILDTISGLFENFNIGDVLIKLRDGILDYIKSGKLTELTEKLFHSLGSILGNLVSSGINTMIDNIRKAINLWEIIKTYFQDQIEEAGGNVAQGILNGIVEGIKNIGDWIYEHIFKPFIDGFKNAFQIHSPSKVMSEMGGYIIQGLLDGINNLKAKVKEVWENIKSAFTTVTATLKDSFSNTWNKIKDGWGALVSKTAQKTAALKNSFTPTWNKMRNSWNAVKNKTATKTAKLKDSFSSAWKKIKNSWKNIKSTSATVVVSIKDKLTSALRSILKGLVNMVNKVIGVLNKIPGINISKISVPKLARGTVVNRATLAEVGEAGREAVVPLQNNTQWTEFWDKQFAKAVQKVRGNGNGNTYIYLDGKSIAPAMVRHRNTLNFETGGVI